MALRNHRDIFAAIADINKRYLHPADSGYKLFEEYNGKNDIKCVELLKDAYGKLVGALEGCGALAPSSPAAPSAAQNAPAAEFPPDAQKKIEGCLAEYTFILQKLQIRTVRLMSIRRLIDLITTPNLNISKADKEKTKEKMRQFHSEFTSNKAEIESMGGGPGDIDRAEQIIGECWRTSDEIEALCHKK